MLVRRDPFKDCLYENQESYIQPEVLQILCLTYYVTLATSQWKCRMLSNGKDHLGLGCFAVRSNPLHWKAEQWGLEYYLLHFYREKRSDGCSLNWLKPHRFEPFLESTPQRKKPTKASKKRRGELAFGLWNPRCNWRKIKVIITLIIV